MHSSSLSSAIPIRGDRRKQEQMSSPRRSGGRELGSGGAGHCLVGEGLGAKGFRMGGEGLPAFLTHGLRHTYPLRKVLVVHCPGGEEEGQSWWGSARALFGGVGMERKDRDKLFHNDEVRETWGPQPS